VTVRVFQVNLLYAVMTSSLPTLGVLDDNHALSAKHLGRLSSRVEITTFPETLPPYGHPTTSAADKQALLERLKPFTIISTMRQRTNIPSDLLRQLTNLKLLLVTGSMHPPVDAAVAKELGIVVAFADGKAPARKGDLSMGSANSTTQHTWALILGLARGVAREDAAMKAGLWQTGMAVGTAGKTLGVVGMGRLGKSVARVGLLAFGMRIICWSTNLTQEKADEDAAKVGLPVEVDGEKTFKVVSKAELFETADVVTIQYALSERSIGLIGKKELDTMKKDALFINTSRGPIVEEQALLDVMQKGAIKGVALDVYDIEPLPKTHPFISEKWGINGRSELLLSPHLGYVEAETLNNFYAETANNLEQWLDGKEIANRLA
jgi:phosphoglycerate dehydrogenase-like enzyme